MKFAAAFATLAVAAIAQDVNTLEEISQNWDNIVSIINGDLPTLKAANPAIYAQATSVIGGTEITQDFNVDLIQQVATGIDPAIMNAVLSRASVTGVTLDGQPIPTDAAPAEDSSDSESPVTSAEESSSEEQSSSDSPSESASSESGSSDNSSEEGSSDSDDSDSEDSSDSDDSLDSEDSEDTTSGANAVVGKILAAGVAAVAALF
ncbi:hypothetical protein EV183_001808 [Coemansia sp. RSA 2336]|nr:hypothetical protein EV183_001808 [Coemansia sp. RSA 2336]